MRIRFLAAILVAYAGCIVLGLMMGSLDINRPPVPAMGQEVRGVWITPLIAAVAWCAFRAYRAYRRKERFETVFFPCAIVTMVAYSYFATMALLNKHLDNEGSAMDMIVTDAFVLHREDPDFDERLVAVSLPAEAGGTAIWRIVNPSTALSRFPIGSRARIIWHKGYFGDPWCEYVDDRFPLHQSRLTEYDEYKRWWRATSAIGQFSAESPCKSKMRSWGIPITDVEDLKEIPMSSQH